MIFFKVSPDHNNLVLNLGSFAKLESYKIYCIYIGSTDLSSSGVLVPITSNVWRASINYSSSPKSIVIDINKEKNEIVFYGDIIGINSLEINNINIY